MMKMCDKFKYANIKSTYLGLLNMALTFILIVCLVQVNFGQDCDFYDDEEIVFTATGGNQTVDYQTVYVLTDSESIVVETSSIDTFTMQAAGDYLIFAINYDVVKGITGLNVGSSITAVTGDCMDVSDQFSVIVCEQIDCSGYFISGSEDVEKCPDQPVVISAGSSDTNTSYVWNTTQEGSSITVNPPVTTTYQVIGTSSDGFCKDTAEITVTVLPLPTITLTDDTEICNGTDIELTASVEAGATVLWSTNETGTSIVVSPTETTTYTANVIVGSCTNSATVTITVNDTPIVSLSSSEGSAICEGSNTTLNAITASSNTFLWNTGATTQSIAVSPTVTTTYTVEVTDDNNCTEVKEIEITVLDNPIATLSSSSGTSFCSGTSTDLTVTTASSNTVEWSTGATTTTIAVNPTVTTTYTVEVTDTNGCLKEEQITIEITGPCDLCENYTCPTECTYCEDEDVIFSVTGGNPSLTTVYVSTDSSGVILEIVSGTNLGVKPIGLGFVFPVNYDSALSVSKLEVGENIFEVSGDCIDIGEPFIYRVCESPIVVIESTEGNSICTGSSTDLSAVTASENSIEWSTGETTTTITVNPTVTTTYTAEVTGENGCMASTSYEVVVLTNPIVEISSTEGNSICSGSSTDLTAMTDSDNNIEWNTGATTGTITVSPTITTTYTVEITDENGCTATASYEVEVIENPTASISSSNGTSFCSGTSTELSVTTESGNNIKWNTGATTATIVVSPTETTTYSVEVENEGCTEEVSITIEVTGPCDLCEIYTCPTECSYCGNDDIILTSQGGNMSFTTVYAITNNTGEIIEISTSNNLGSKAEGLYFVFPINYDPTSTVNNLEVGKNISEVNGECLDIGEPYVFRVCEAFEVELELSNNGVICPNDEIQITASVGMENNFMWNTTATTRSIIVTPSDTTHYSVIVTSPDGCVDTAEVTVNVSPCNRLGNYVWHDANGDGLQDDNEDPLAGVTVYLIDSETGDTTMTTTTDQEGMYMFEGINPGSYHIAFEPPTGFRSTLPNFMTNDSIDSDNDDSNGPNTTRTIEVTNVTEDLSIDAGFVPAASIGNYVWFEETVNGLNDDENDVPLEGIVVQLIDVTNTVIATTTTDADGFYLFDHLRSGFYTVQFEPQEDMNFVPSNMGDDNIDSDVVNITTGRTNILLLGVGQHRRDVDAGYTNIAALPIELLYFTGHHEKPMKANILEWSTALEINSKGFTLQRMDRESGSYRDIYFVESATNTVNIQEYEFNDYDVEEGNTYLYKLIHQDLDGTISEYGPVKIVIAGTKGKVSLYPNPTSDQVTIDYINPFNGDINISVFNATGQLVRVLNNYDRVSASSLYLDMTDYTNGVYTFRIDVGDDTFVERVVKL